MENFKGTKGKWYVSQPNGKSICAESDNAIGYDVVVVQDGFISKYSHTAKANALLASKAPEMLEMLIRLKDVIKHLGGTHYSQYTECEALIKSATEL